MGPVTGNHEQLPASYCKREWLIILPQYTVLCDGKMIFVGKTLYLNKSLLIAF